MELITAKAVVGKLKKGGTMTISEAYFSKMVRTGVVPYASTPGKKRRLFDYEVAKEALLEAKDPSREPQREANKRRREGLPTQTSKKVGDMTAEEAIEYNALLEAEQDKLSKDRDTAKGKGADVKLETMPNSLNKVKIFRELYQGKIAQLDYKKKNEELVEKSEVERDGFESGRLIRDNLQNIPHKVSVLIAGISDPKKIESIIAKEIQEVLENISK